MVGQVKMTELSIIPSPNAKIFLESRSSNICTLTGFYTTPGISTATEIKQILYDYNNYVSSPQIAKKYGYTIGQIRHFYDRNNIKSKQKPYHQESDKIVSMYSHGEKNINEIMVMYGCVLT